MTQVKGPSFKSEQNINTHLLPTSLLHSSMIFRLHSKFKEDDTFSLML